MHKYFKNKKNYFNPNNDLKICVILFPQFNLIPNLFNKCLLNLTTNEHLIQNLYFGDPKLILIILVIFKLFIQPSNNIKYSISYWKFLNLLLIFDLLKSLLIRVYLYHNYKT